jgi:hypothetical protein
MDHSEGLVDLFQFLTFPLSFPFTIVIHVSSLHAHVSHIHDYADTYYAGRP